ncbi:methyltransferase domain-containing protein [Solidesulfovibrio alcoholivorans]|uniref:methyltransferase domain-containing protein n=1 Tax=Solidesulfovibrio alcoholivorans TaxID=81406 RepID=UPI0009FC891F|nr:methyltransferase domain-containing protein [Solidesulfovibrio alcoholivorans]
MWLKNNSSNYTGSGYFPNSKFGVVVNGLKNEDLENQTFEDAVFDLVIHLDVMEHLFHPFKALNEIWRTLKVNGHCIFAAPTYPEKQNSEQVAFVEDGELRVIGDPEYHGNPQNSEGSLVTWRYGYDLPQLITRNTKFKNVEVRRWQSMDDAIMGIMTEIYILRK